MSALNIYHDVVVHALRADGWTITHDPFTISYGSRDLFVDLAAERSPIGAEKDDRRIAVEVQSFLNQSAVHDLGAAIGQFEMYRTLLEEIEPDRQLYLAVPKRVHEGILCERLGQLLVSRLTLRYLVFDQQTERILQWID